jgi:hypothetical protein
MKLKRFVRALVTLSIVVAGSVLWLVAQGRGGKDSSSRSRSDGASWAAQARMTEGMENVRAWKGWDASGSGSGSGAISQAERKAWRDTGKTGREW